LTINTTFDFIDRLNLPTDGPSLIGSFQELIGEMGMGSFLMGTPERLGVPVEERVWANTWPEQWMQHWASRKYMAVDPVAKRLMTDSAPVRWTDVYRNSNKAGLRILKEANEHGMQDGFALPIYSRDGFVVGISMATAHYELGEKEEKCLHMASIYFHTRLERMRAKNIPPSRTPKVLTQREQECLCWVASGKTDWEISQILNIAEQTVHEYVQNTLIKLNATTRAQAVAVAIYTKQIML
jgi:LuxR family quorum sensing-dependent transcriptional regulator